MDLCESLAGRRPRRLNRSSGTINSTTAYGARTRKPRHKPLFAIRGGRGSVRAACGEPGRAERANGSPGGSPSRIRVILSRTIRCRSTPGVFKPFSCRPSNATTPRPAPPSWIVSAWAMRNYGIASRPSSWLAKSPTASSISRSSSLNISFLQSRANRPIPPILRAASSRTIWSPPRSCPLPPGILSDPEAGGTLFFKLPPDPPLSAERPAPTVSGYEILGELGRGGMGVVYRARQIRLNRPCVLKMILGGGHARPSRQPASLPKPSRSPDFSTPASCRSTISARPTACRTSSWNTSPAAVWTGG